MNVQSLDATRRRVALYRDAMGEAGHDAAAIADNLKRSWVWRNVFVAATDAEAERIGVPLFEAMTRTRAELRNRIYAETGQRIEVPQSDLPEARADGAQGLLRGSPETVAAALAGIDELGIGGVLASFRLGPMPYSLAAESLGLFMREVAPTFRS
jgi:alkanesulfonate monooxygenase SsuD/methylene tetrahydromethanopterin reductase-like flavin-dependent oxidoreductase (luciferase family)